MVNGKWWMMNSLLSTLSSIIYFSLNTDYRLPTTEYRLLNTEY
jgi:hypothetical protein